MQLQGMRERGVRFVHLIGSHRTNILLWQSKQKKGNRSDGYIGVGVGVDEDQIILSIKPELNQIYCTRLR